MFLKVNFKPVFYFGKILWKIRFLKTVCWALGATNKSYRYSMEVEHSNLNGTTSKPRKKISNFVTCFEVVMEKTQMVLVLNWGHWLSKVSTLPLSYSYCVCCNSLHTVFMTLIFGEFFKAYYEFYKSISLLQFGIKVAHS